MCLNKQNSEYAWGPKHAKLPNMAKFSICRSSLPEMFCNNGVLRNFTKFTRKHLCQVSFLIKLQA